MEPDSHSHLEERLAHFKERVSLKRFNPCLKEEEIRNFEETHQVVLPLGYRLFLLLIGNGGHGLTPLPVHKDTSEYPLLAYLNRDFPYLYPTPFMTFESFIIWYQSNPKAIEQFVDVPTFRNNYYATHREEIENQLTLFKVKTFFEGETFLEDLYEAYLYSPHHRDGTLPLGDLGQEESYVLIVSGKRRGRVWGHDLEKMYPLFGPDGPLDFLSWLEEMV